jgi:hypothetical protein
VIAIKPLLLVNQLKQAGAFLWIIIQQLCCHLRTG